MSSFATARARSDKNPPRLLADFHSQPSLDHPAGSLAVTSPIMDQVSRVERLLTQVESSSVALVPYGFGNVNGTVAKVNNGVIAVAFIVIWVGTFVLGIAYMRYSSHSPQIVQRASGALVIPAAPDVQDQKVAQSVDHLAKALISSSERLTELEAEMRRSQRARTKANDHSKAPVRGNPEVDPASKPITAHSTEVVAPKNWHRVLDIPPTSTAVSHKGPDGSIDYWLVPRGSDNQQTRVLPIGTGPEGVIVHSLDDGNDYTLTSTGEWRNGAIAVP